MSVQNLAQVRYSRRVYWVGWMTQCGGPVWATPDQGMGCGVNSEFFMGSHLPCYGNCALTFFCDFCSLCVRSPLTHNIKIFNQIPSSHQPGLHIGRAFTGRLSQHPPSPRLLAVEFSVIHPSDHCVMCTSPGAKLSGFEPWFLFTNLVQTGYLGSPCFSIVLFSC